MSTADDILQELRAHRRALVDLFASGEETADATHHEADAKRHSDDAMRHREAARKARDEDDDEDAKRHEEDASKARMEARKARMEARKWYEADAKKRREAGEEEAAKQRDADAARMTKDEEDAKRREDEEDADATRADEDAAGKRDTKMPMWAMFLRAMMQDEEIMDAEKDTWNLSLLKKMMGMTYPPGRTLGKRGKQEAAHDDEAEDVALFRRLMKQYTKDDAMNAARTVPDLRQERRLRNIEAAMGEMSKLLTDVVHGLRDLATDTTHGRRDLATDSHRGQQGGPVRKTLSATGTDFRGKYDDQTHEQTAAEIDAALDAQGMTDPTQRIAAKLTLMGQGGVQQ